MYIDSSSRRGYATVSEGRAAGCWAYFESVQAYTLSTTPLLPQGIDEAAAKDQDAMDAAKVKYDAKLTSWAEDHGKKRNVRTLLSTMHLVSWHPRKGGGGGRGKEVVRQKVCDSILVTMTRRAGEGLCLG